VTQPLQFVKSVLSRQGRIAVLALASDKVNALDRQVLDEITAFIDLCEQDPDIGALVVTGQGKFFSAGLNVNEILANEADYGGVILNALGQALVRLLRCPLPTVAAVNGAAIAGGCLLACACDRRLIGAEARMGVTELKVGVAFPVLTVELLKYVCGSHAEQVMFDAGLFDAEQACRYGLAHEQRPEAELVNAAVAAAEQLASLDARAYALAKATARRALLASANDESGRALDRQVLEHWKDDVTRANLQRLLGPKS
jgi:enoyl-CoA hydratase/carnithine racemase